MSHCKDCKHWQKRGRSGACQLYGFGLMIYVPHDEGTEIETDAEFGCVQFEAKQ